MFNSRKYIGSGIVAGALALAAASTAQANLLIDVRPQSGGREITLTAADAGKTFTFDVYAVVSGANAAATDDGFQYVHGGFKSANGPTGAAALGTLTATFDAPFNTLEATGLGQNNDVDGDGDLDLGSSNSSTTAAFWQARAATMQSGGEFKLGTVTFAIDTVSPTPAGGSLKTTVQFFQRGAAAAYSQWRIDNQNVKWTASVGNPADTFSVQGIDFVVSGGGPVAQFVADLVGTVPGAPTANWNGLDLNVVTLPTPSAIGAVNLASTAQGAADPTLVLVYGEFPQGFAEALDGANDDFVVLGAGDPDFDVLKRVDPELQFIAKFAGPMNGKAFQWDFTDPAGLSGMVSRIAVVPEPASLTLLGLGALGLIARRRR